MHRRFVNVCFVCAFALLLSLRPAHAQGWSTGLGGNSRRNGFTPVHGPRDGRVLWQRNSAKAVIFQPVTDGDRMFTSECASPCDESSTDWLAHLIANTRVVARQVRSGLILWTATVPVEHPTDGVASVIGANNGLVFVTRSSNFSQQWGPIYALRESDGSLVWTSEDSFGFCDVDSPAFEENGDLIVGSGGSVARIRARDGMTVWRTPVESSSAPFSAAVGKDVVYVAVSDDDGGTIAAVDPDTGDILYAAPSPGVAQFAASVPFTGPGGAVYLPTFGGQIPFGEHGVLTAFRDTGSDFILLWRAELPANMIYQSFAVGPDGSVYSYSVDHRIVRLDPATGAVRAQSKPLPWDGRLGENDARMAIDATGRLYVSAPSEDPTIPAGVFCFDRNLSPLWQDLGLYIPPGTGLALAADGSLILPDEPSPFPSLNPNALVYRVYAASPAHPRIAPPVASSPAPITGRGGH